MPAIGPKNGSHGAALDAAGHESDKPAASKAKPYDTLSPPRAKGRPLPTPRLVTPKSIRRNRFVVVPIAKATVAVPDAPIWPDVAHLDTSDQQAAAMAANALIYGDKDPALHAPLLRIIGHLGFNASLAPSTDNAVPPARSPTRDELQALCGVFRSLGSIHFDCYADRCHYRAHVFADLLRRHGYDCHKLFVHGDLCAQTPEGPVKWYFHVAPLVYLRDAAMAPCVVDLSLYPAGPCTPWKWLSMFHNEQAVQLEITDSSLLHSPISCSNVMVACATLDHSVEFARQHLGTHFETFYKDDVLVTQRVVESRASQQASIMSDSGKENPV